MRGPSDTWDLAIIVADALSGSWLDSAWDCAGVRAFIDHAAAAGGLDPKALRRRVALRLLRDPELLEYPPTVAIQALLERLLALASISRASLWTRDESGEVACVYVAGVDSPRDDARALATHMLSCGESAAAEPEAGALMSVPVMRWQQQHAVLIAEPADCCRDDCALLASEAAASVAPIIERHALLERNADRERALVSASERGLERLGLDLHDRPIQDLAVLADDLRLFRSQLETVLGSHEHAHIALGRVDDLEARLVALHSELREMSHSLVSPMLLKRPLHALLEGEAASFRSMTDIELTLETAGDLEGVSVSQRVALLRILHEALSNAREHGNARSVSVRLRALPTHIEATIVDDGRGFDVHSTLVDAARRGRLGLVGMVERARLLGGRCDVSSNPGGPTRIEVRLPRFDAVAADGVAANGRETHA